MDTDVKSYRRAVTLGKFTGRGRTGGGRQERSRVSEPTLRLLGGRADRPAPVPRARRLVPRGSAVVLPERWWREVREVAGFGGLRGLNSGLNGQWGVWAVKCG